MDFSVNGPKILFTIPTDIPVLGDLEITETIVISWVVLLVLTVLCIWLTHDLRVEKISKRQVVAEMLYEMAHNFIKDTMGEKFMYYVPFVSALFVTSLLSNLVGVTGFRSPTADLSTEAAWAGLVFILITAQKIKTGGVGGYLRGFTQPVALLTPLNIISEFSTPISMACRHFGNLLSGIVINGLLYAALASLSSLVFGLLPGILGGILSQIPFFSLGIPAVLSLYFDWFTGFMQAYIFCMLTTIYIANAAEE